MEVALPQASRETTCSVDISSVAFALSLHLSGAHKTPVEDPSKPAETCGCSADGDRAANSAEQQGCSIEGVFRDLFLPGMDEEVAETISDALFALARLGEICIERTHLRTILKGPGGVGGAITSVDLGDGQALASQYLQRELQTRLASASIRLKNSLKGSEKAGVQ
jgi:hypothetical protein